MLHMFNRCQLNVSCYKPAKHTQELEVIPALCEVIIQQRDANNLAVYNAIKNKVGISILLDASGGHGIDTKIVPLGLEGVKIGYAGGINPDNVAEKLSTLLDSELTNNFWIDMESGVRTDDWFDLDKAHKVLETCKQVMQ
jgi:phosphoribosylanthranilate isomerase